MVTIKQKLSVFSKLLHQTMETEYADRMKKLEEVYNEKLSQSQRDIDAKAENIIKKAKNKADSQLAENSSKASIGLKKESISIKEKYFNIFMKEIRSEIDVFKGSDKYEVYIYGMLNQILKDNKLSNNLVIYMTDSDIERFSAGIGDKLLAINKDTKAEFKRDDEMIGGLILEDIDNKFRINMSIQSILEENESYIINLLYTELDKAGELSDK